jgi:hypothetical protein
MKKLIGCVGFCVCAGAANCACILGVVSTADNTTTADSTSVFRIVLPSSICDVPEWKIRAETDVPRAALNIDRRDSKAQ